MTTTDTRCTHGGDCEVHPDVHQLHDFSPGSGVEYIPRRGIKPQPEYLGSARLVMTAPEVADRPGEWKALRRRDPVTGSWRLTASEMASVLDFAPDEQPGPRALYHQKIDGIETFQGNDRTEFGLFCEDFVAPRFAATHPELEVGPGGFYVSKAYPWLGATFDRIAYDIRFNCDGRCPGTSEHLAGCRQEWAEELSPAGPVQIKSWAQRADFGHAGSDVIPLHLRVQLLTEMAVLGSDIAYEPVVFLPSSQVITYVIERTPEVDQEIAAIIKAGEEFIRCLEEELPPEVDWRPATRDVLRKLYPIDPDAPAARVPVKLARRLHRARKAHKAAERRLKLAQNEVRARAGSAPKIVAYDAVAGEDRVIAARSGGPRAGYSVAPSEYVETLRAGNWGKA